MLKRSIKRFFRAVGLDIRSVKWIQPRDANKQGVSGDDEYRSSIKNLLQRLNTQGFSPATIIDVGVKLGTDGLYDVFPDAYYLLIDPVEENEVFMNRIVGHLRHADSRLVALGDQPGELPLRVEADGNATLRDATAHPDSRTVPIVTLDSLDAERPMNGPVVLKIDTEGYELPILQGATTVLERTELVILEVNFIPRQSIPEFFEIHRFLHDHGFALYDIFDMRERPRDGALGLADVAFVKKDGAFRVEKSFRTPAQRRLNADMKEQLRRSAMEELLP